MRKAALLTFLFISSLTISFADPSWKASISRNTAFIENKGQVMDQHNRENKEVRFMYVDGLFNLQLRKDGFSYELFTIDEKKASFPEYGIPDNEEQAFRNFVDDQSTMRSHRIDVTLVGANPAAEITGEEATGIVYNFYTDGTGTQGVTGVASFEKVKYKNIYPGIDLVFFAPDQSADSFLKYEWIVHPGADASKIKLQYNGAISFLPDTDGGFKLYAATGIINESKVIAFRADDRSPVPAQYHFNHNTVSYKIKRDKENTIVIDPNILWSSYYGGELSEDVNNGELAVDKQSKVIIVGSTFSTMHIATNGAFQTSFAGGYHDAIIAKFTTAGKLSWATYYGAAGKDEGHAITTDKDNNIFIAGLTTSQTVISTPGAFQTQLGGYSDAFVVKFNANGMRLWGTYLGGSIQDEILGMDCDKNGNLYFTGYTVSPDHIATPGAHQDTMNNPGGNNGDAFLGAFSPGGSLRWCSYFSGPAQDRAHGICVGKNSDLFIEGTAESTTQFATAGVHQSIFAGGPTDAFLAKWDTSGNFYWCSYLGGINEEHGRGVKTDGAGNPYIIGWSNSHTGMSTPGAYQEEWFEAYENDGFPKYDGFLAKFKKDGSLEWGTYYGGGGKDQIFDLTIDNANDVVYCGGLTASTLNIGSPESYQPELGGKTDGFFSKFSLTGTRIWGSYFGADNSEELHGMELDKEGFMYILLSTDGNGFSVTPEAYQATNKGEEEAIITRLNVADACYDKYEPNNTNSTGYLIKAYEDAALWGYTAAISSSADADWYKMKLSATTNLKLVLTDLPADYDLKLYKSNGQLLFTSANAGTVEETIIYNGAPNGNYVIHIVHASNVFDPNNCYRLQPVISDNPWLQKAGQAATQQASSLQASVYPNPAVGEINLKITSAFSQQVQVTLYNILHQPVYFQTIEAAENTQELRIPATHLTSGLYFVELIHNGEKQVMKVQLL
jgi:hypothetical protein